MNDDKTYSVYMHVFPDGKKYIGMSKDIEHRWIGNGSAYKNRGRIGDVIGKYDWENDVKHIIIASNLTKEESEQKEIELITKYQTTKEECGYNVHEGGSGKKKVIQYTTDMKLIKIWDSMTDASKELNIAKNSISACCSDVCKTAGGFVWRRYDEVFGDKLSKGVIIRKKSW